MKFNPKPQKASEEAAVEKLLSTLTKHHLNTEVLDRFFENTATELDHSIAKAHCKSCPECQKLYAEATHVDTLPDWYLRLSKRFGEGVKLLPLLFLDALDGLTLPENISAEEADRRIWDKVKSTDLDWHDDGQTEYGIRRDDDGLRVFYRTTDKSQLGNKIRILVVTPDLEHPANEQVNYEDVFPIADLGDLRYGFERRVRELKGVFTEYSRLIFTGPVPAPVTESGTKPSLVEIIYSVLLGRPAQQRSFDPGAAPLPIVESGSVEAEGNFLEGVHWRITRSKTSGRLSLEIEATAERFYNATIDAVWDGGSPKRFVLKQRHGSYKQEFPIPSPSSVESAVPLKLILVSQEASTEADRTGQEAQHQVQKSTEAAGEFERQKQALASALGQGREALERILQEEGRPEWVRVEAANLLGQSADVESLPAIKHVATYDPAFMVRQAARHASLLLTNFQVIVEAIFDKTAERIDGLLPTLTREPGFAGMQRVSQPQRLLREDSQEGMDYRLDWIGNELWLNLSTIQPNYQNKEIVILFTMHSVQAVPVLYEVTDMLRKKRSDPNVAHLRKRLLELPPDREFPALSDITFAIRQ